MSPYVLAALVGGIIYYFFGRSNRLATQNQAPTQPAAIDSRYFTVKPDGLVYFNSVSAPSVRALLANMAVAPIEGDPKHVELIPFTFGQAVTAAAWAEALRKQNLYIIVSRWAHLPIAQPRYARAQSAYGVASFATPSGDYALLEPEAVALSTSAPPITQQTPPTPQQTQPIPQQTQPIPQQTQPIPQSDPWANLPPQIADDVKNAYTNGTDPIALEKAALELDRLGFPEAANQYKSKAKALRMGQSLRTITLREGDNPSFLAKHFTGEAGRWKELLATNPSLQPVTIEGRTYVQPWKPGQKVILPNDWPVEKGMPSALGSGPKVTPTGGL